MTLGLCWSAWSQRMWHNDEVVADPRSWIRGRRRVSVPQRSTNPEKVAGEYALVRVDEATLPVVVSQTETHLRKSSAVS